jgi:hypothetical protein
MEQFFLTRSNYGEMVIRLNRQAGV